MAVELVVFFRKNVRSYAFFCEFINKFSVVESCIKSQAVACDLFDEFVHGAKLLFSKIESLDDFSGIDDACHICSGLF